MREMKIFIAIAATKLKWIAFDSADGFHESIDCHDFRNCHDSSGFDSQEKFTI